MHWGAAASAGLLAGAVVAAGLYSATFAWPGRMRANVFHLLGSIAFVEARPIYWWGALSYGILAALLGMAHVALQRPLAPLAPQEALWVLSGLLQYGVLGAFLGLAGALHPAVRAGELPPPGPFAWNQAVAGRSALLVASLAYGVLAGAFYRLFL